MTFDVNTSDAAALIHVHGGAEAQWMRKRWKFANNTACARTHLVHSWAWNFLRNYCSVSVAGIRPLCVALRRLFRDIYAYFARWMGKTHQTVEEMKRSWRLLLIFKKAKRRETTRNDLLILIIMLSNNQNCIKFKLKMRAHWILNLN